MGQRIIDGNLDARGIQVSGEIPFQLCLRRHRQTEQVALARTVPFVSEIEEGFVLADGPAQGGAELVLHEGRFTGAGPVGEEVRCVQRPVAQELVGAAVKFIGAGLGRQVDDAARVPAVLRGVVAGLHAELGNGILAGHQRGDIAISDIHGNAVEVRGGLVSRSAADLIIAGREHAFAGEITIGRALRHHSRR